MRATKGPAGPPHWRPLVALWLAPYATRAAALPLGLNLMPLASALLLWLVWSRGAVRERAPAAA